MFFWQTEIIRGGYLPPNENLLYIYANVSTSKSQQNIKQIFHFPLRLIIFFPTANKMHLDLKHLTLPQNILMNLIIPLFCNKSRHLNKTKKVHTGQSMLYLCFRVPIKVNHIR